MSNMLTRLMLSLLILHLGSNSPWLGERKSKRSCFPKLDAIKNAIADILIGLNKKPVTLSWEDNNCSTMEISGLEIGWGQVMNESSCLD
ncbi:hypothetical protein Fmac_025357 [Flemingia macrophylla]|uniref:Uncharacterized protein n=1 Tax=Flemingia macrophylla TaxID=520843 RepID=A0ABD1LS19_9FABA